jgi:hypothetical protein
MTLHPKVPMDLALAPVAAAVDLNLQGLRDLSLSDLHRELGLRLDRPPIPNDRTERAKQILQAALRNVDLHGWSGSISDDASRLQLGGGSVSIDLGLSAGIMAYIETGA